MKTPFSFAKRATAAVAAAATIVFALAVRQSGSGQPAPGRAGSASGSNAPPLQASVELSPGQTNAIRIEPVGVYSFPVEREAVGSIDFDEDLSVQVFSPYQGKILTALANLGDEVKKGQPLYTIDSSDLVQAESTLIGAAAAYALTSKELGRAKDLYGTNGVSEREIEQATADEQTAEGALKAARDAVRLFGKTEAEIDRMIAARSIDPALVVVSPIAGRVTARNAQPGLLVQPGNAPAPYAVADLSTKWMVANVNESDSPLLQAGQPARVKVMAFPGRMFEGVISRLGASVDATTRRVMARCDIKDPKDELRPGMLADFVIRVQAPVESVALAMNGVVRNGDGTVAAWVTTDGKRFEQRILTLGAQRDGRYQVLDGLRRGELAVSDGAIFLSNMLQAPPSD